MPRQGDISPVRAILHTTINNVLEMSLVVEKSQNDLQFGIPPFGPYFTFFLV
ncbi:hypothetical protein ACJX0J_038560, partial [Zea mays]